ALIQALREGGHPLYRAALWRRALPVATAAVLAWLLPAWPVAVEGTARIAAVQGNADSGLFAQRERGDILDDHLQATVPMLNEDVDVLVWPENAVDLNPLRYAYAAQTLEYVTAQLDAPMVFGTVTDCD